MSTGFRRIVSVLATGIALVCTGPAPWTVPAAQAAPPTTRCATGTPVTGDYNGDGSPDLAVSVRLNSEDASNLFVSTTRNSTGTWLDLGDINGRSNNVLTTADLDGDRCADAILRRWNGFTLIHGSANGLMVAERIALDVPRAAGHAQECRAATFVHDALHQVVVACSTWDGADADDMVINHADPFIYVYTLGADGPIGEPQVIGGPLDLGTPTVVAADAHAVVVGSSGEAVLVLTPDGSNPVRLVHRASITQATPGVAGTVGDHAFGESLALRDGYLAIGARLENLGSAKRAGRVHLLRWKASTRSFASVRAISQGTRGVVGTNESGDRFGSTLAIARGLTGSGSYDVIIGASHENVGSIGDAGSVTVANVTKARYRTYTQNTKGVPGKAEKSDPGSVSSGEHFGRGISVLPTSATTDTLAIGAPGETNDGCINQGYIAVSDGRKLTSATKWTYLKPPTEGCSIYDGDEFYGWGQEFGN
nr:VCBS repeat-containing protein [Propionicimonas sp.]